MDIKKRRNSSISLPLGDTELSAMPTDNDDAEATKQEITPALNKFFKEAGSQHGPVKKKRKASKKSNEDYAINLLSVPRSDIEKIDQILKQLPKFIGRKRPDFNKEDFQRLAIKMLIEKCEKMVAKGKKLNILKR